MRNLGIVLICLSALAFVLALIVVIIGPIWGIPAEGFSRACSNLALIAIGLFLCRKCEGEGKAGEE
jgi:hypothetical protein